MNEGKQEEVVHDPERCRIYRSRRLGNPGPAAAGFRPATGSNSADTSVSTTSNFNQFLRAQFCLYGLQI